MLNQTAEIMYGLIGQLVIAYPPDWADGAPSAASATVRRGDLGNDDAAEFTASGTVDAISTTVSVASGFSQSYPNRLYLASLTSLETGRPYRLDNGQGQRQLVVLKRIDTAGGYAEADGDLLYDYPIGSTLVGIRMVFTVDPTWVALDTKILDPEYPPYRVIWTYTCAATSRRYFTYLRLVRKPWQSLVTMDDLRDVWPDIMYAEGSEARGERVRRAITVACTEVRADIIAAGYQPETLEDTELLKQLQVCRTWRVLARTGITPTGRDPETFIAEAKQDYTELLDRTVRGALRIAASTDNRGAIDPEPIGSFFAER